jgi:hypothetical protein
LQGRGNVPLISDQRPNMPRSALQPPTMRRPSLAPILRREVLPAAKYTCFTFVSWRDEVFDELIHGGLDLAPASGGHRQSARAQYARRDGAYRFNRDDSANLWP